MAPYLYYKLFDTSGHLRVADSNSFISAADGYTGRIDLRKVPPPRRVSDIAQAIAEQEGCADTFDSSEWALYRSLTSSAALPEDGTLPKAAGSQPLNPLIFRFEADTGPEREQEGVVLASRRNYPTASVSELSSAPPPYSAAVSGSDSRLHASWTAR